jgi:WD40 repeat protein
MTWFDSDSLLLGYDGGRLNCWHVDRRTVTPVETVEGAADFLGKASRVAVSADSRWVTACWEGPDSHKAGGVVVWRRAAEGAAPADFDGGYARHAFISASASGETYSHIWSAAVLERDPDQPLIALAGSMQEILLFDARNTLLGKLTGHSSVVGQLCALDGRRLVSASRDGTVLVWDVAEQEDLCELYRAEGQEPTMHVHKGRINILDENRLITADPRDIDRFIAGNREYQRQHLAARDR